MSLNNRPVPILVLDGDAASRSTLKEQLGADTEFLPEEASRIAEVAKKILGEKELSVDAIIMEAELPDGDGRDFCASLRRERIMIPIIMLTASLCEDDIVRCLDAGANDYVRKPFRKNELIARLRAQLRIFGYSDDVVFPVGSYQFRPWARTLYGPRGDTPIRLTATETEILKHLCRAQGEPVRKEVLLRQVWNNSAAATMHTLETHVYHLRKKLEPRKTCERILLFQNGGYRLLL